MEKTGVNYYSLYAMIILNNLVNTGQRKEQEKKVIDIR